MNHWALKIGTLLGVVTALGYWKRKRPVGRHVAHVNKAIDRIGRRSGFEGWGDCATGSIPERRTG